MINVLVCDDDKDILSEVEALLKNYENAVGADFNIDLHTSGDFIFNEKKKYDIAVLDIEMPKINGIELSKMLSNINPDIIVIILTSYQKYLDDAMRVHVFRYLSKPIDENRFFENLKDAVNEIKSISKSITVKSAGNYHLIKTKDILYIENSKNGSVIITKNCDLITNKKPSELLEIIDQPQCFVYSHNSIIVNLQNVINFSKTTVTLRKNEDEIVETFISQRKYTQFKQAFFEYAGDMIWTSF